MRSATYKLIYLGLGAVLVGVIAAAVALAPSGDEIPLPEAVDSIFPRPGDSVVRQTTIEVDMAVGYTIELTVDGFRIPTPQISAVLGTGRHVWRPAPGRFIEDWSVGTHHVAISWDRPSGLPDPGSMDWTFRVQ